MTTTTTYTAPQFAALRALARAYGHGWATSEIPDAHPISGCLWTQSLIREFYTAVCRRDALEPWQVGIPDPGSDDYSGSVCHTTGTGRVSWQVADDGTVGIAISRPAPGRGDGEDRHAGVVVLSARVRGGAIEEIRTPDTRDHRIPDVHSATWSSDGGPRAEARHGDAMLEALCALIEPAAARVALEAAGVPLTESADPLQGYSQGYSPDEIVVGPGGQTLEQAAAEERGPVAQSTEQPGAPTAADAIMGAYVPAPTLCLVVHVRRDEDGVGWGWGIDTPWQVDEGGGFGRHGIASLEEAAAQAGEACRASMASMAARQEV